MEKWCLFLVLAILSNETFGFGLRNKRQDENSEVEDNLEDRYGWNRPNRPNRPIWQFPGQGQFPFPGQGQGQPPVQGQFPFPGQGQSQPPVQGQFPFPGQGQGQPPVQGQFPFPGQGQGQFPGQGQGQGQLPGQGQGQGQLPGQGQGQLPGTGQGQQGQAQNSTPAPNAATTQSSATQACIGSCPVTAEYNPVCGSDGVTYTNPGRLSCAQACGVAVNFLRAARCPGSIQAN